jgi:DNA-binding Xre family transcriptional regulator
VARSLRVSSEHIKNVKQAMIHNGFLSQQDLARDLEIALSTVSLFFNGKSVSRENYVRICEKLKLNWGEIIDINLDLKSPNILLIDYSLSEKLSFISQFKKTFLSHEKIVIALKSGEAFNTENISQAESLIFAVSNYSTPNIDCILEEIIRFKNLCFSKRKQSISLFLIHVDSLMHAPLNHPIHQQLNLFEQLEWSSNNNMDIFVKNILEKIQSEKRTNRIKSFMPNISQLDTSKKWLLTYIGENQLQKLGALVADLKNSDERQIRSGYSYWGLGPAYMWERACNDSVGYHMRENIQCFPKSVEALSQFIDRERFNFVSLGVGEGSKIK